MLCAKGLVVDANIINQAGEESSRVDGFGLVSRMGHFFIFFDIFRDCSSNAEFSSILFFVFHCFCSSVTYLSSFSYLRHTHHAAYQSLSVSLCSQEFAPCIYFFASCDVGGSPAQPHLMLTAITNHREKLMPFRDSARIIF